MSKPTIIEVILDGMFMSSEDAISKIKGKYSDENISKYRVAPYCFCAICNNLLFLTKGKSKDYHFSHYNNAPKDCPQRTHNSEFSASDIDSIKNANLKEGKEHIKLKNMVAQMIEKDDNFSSLHIEQVINNMSLLEKSKWRRPDVRGTWKDMELIFEIQLQTILIYHIKGRTDFYKNNKKYLLWCFKDLTIYDFKISFKDIFYNNNSNGFYISDKVLEESKKQNKFMIGCIYIEYMLKENKYLHAEYQKKIVSLDELIFDEKNYKVYYFNTELEREILITYIFVKASNDFFYIRLRRENNNYSLRYEYRNYMKNNYNVLIPSTDYFYKTEQMAKDWLIEKIGKSFKSDFSTLHQEHFSKSPPR